MEVKRTQENAENVVEVIIVCCVISSSSSWKLRAVGAAKVLRKEAGFFQLQMAQHMRQLVVMGSLLFLPV